MRVVKFVIYMALISGLAYAQECRPDEFQCDNGRCIPGDGVCDGYNECGDASDEQQDCSLLPCADDQWQCANGVCIYPTWFCDGNNDCGDGSDEADENGNCPECPASVFQCNNGRCVVGFQVCNGENNCGDGSDEQQNCPPCPDDRFQCANGPCTAYAYICDGDDDCGDGSDEADENGKCPECHPLMFQCPNTGRCINRPCDGTNDCGDWSDETEEACPCADDDFRCPRAAEDGPAGACIPPELVCDEEGIWDCPNGEDEANCTVHSVGTKHSQPHRIRPFHLKLKNAAIKLKTLNSSKSKKILKSKHHLWYEPKKQMRKEKH